MAAPSAISAYSSENTGQKLQSYRLVWEEQHGGLDLGCSLVGQIEEKSLVGKATWNLRERCEKQVQSKSACPLLAGVCFEFAASILFCLHSASALGKQQCRFSCLNTLSLLSLHRVASLKVSSVSGPNKNACSMLSLQPQIPVAVRATFLSFCCRWHYGSFSFNHPKSEVMSYLPWSKGQQKSLTKFN